MKKKISLFALIIFLVGIVNAEIHEDEKSTAQTESSPFKISPVADGIALGMLAGSAAFSYSLPKIISLPEYDEFTYYLDDVNSLDRKFARKYNRKLDRAGDISLALSYCLVPAIYGTEWFNGNFESRDGISLAVIYSETILATQTAKCLLKNSFKRKRPYMYFDGYPKDELDNYDFEFSFPSGHTTDSFMNATFLSYTFCKYYPDSNLKVPVMTTAYSVAVLTAGLRIASGNHFLTDTIAGAALGSLMGFAVPWLHTIGKKVSTDDVKVAFSPSGSFVSFRF